MHDSKDTNPKDALGIKKAPLHLVPTGPLFEVGLAMMEGGRKYGAHNYRAVGTRSSVYYDAALRHITAWWEGEDVDLDSDIHPLMKAAACLFVIRDSMLMGNHVDDRPIKYPDGLNIKKFNKQTAEIIKKIPDCVAPFLEKDRKFVCPAGWEIFFFSDGCGWFIQKEDVLCRFLHKNLTLNGTTGWDGHKYGVAPGYWPTKEAAEDALKQYLEKTK